MLDTEEIINGNMLYTDELKKISDIKLSKAEEEQAIEELKSMMHGMEEAQKDKVFMGKMAKLNRIADLSHDDLYERYLYYKEALDFIKTPQADEIYKEYQQVILPNDDGLYSIDTELTETLINSLGLYIKDKDILEEIKQNVWLIWENQRNMITKDTLNDYAEKRTRHQL